jgi:3D (Asp-Asp-Asp) domain-containing protein
MRIYIERATPLFIQADGQVVKVHTHRETVGEVLAEQGFALMGQDYSRVPLESPVASNETIEIVRVRETVEFQEEYIPFETEWVPDETMELDQRAVLQTGATGILRTRTRVRFENDEEIWRNFEDEWLAQEPADQVIAYGTNIVVRTLETPDGPIEYWRRISMRATAYSAATSGKDADHPRYGITSTGMKAGFGIVAVDPKVIPLRTQLYIDKYGEAIAGDTGGRIQGKHIDLGYPDDQPLPQIFEWRDVYVLTPVPPANSIRFVLPNWPQR